MRILKSNKNPDKRHKSLIIALLSVAGLLVSIFYFIPWNERVGNAVAMIFAVIFGSFYTRYLRGKNKEE